MHGKEHGENCPPKKFSVPKVFEKCEISEISKKAVLTSELLEKIRNSFKFGTEQEFIDLLVKEGTKPTFASRIINERSHGRISSRIPLRKGTLSRKESLQHILPEILEVSPQFFAHLPATYSMLYSQFVE